MGKKDNRSELFDAWISTYQGLLFKIVRSFATDIHAQNDLFQEIAIRLWQSVTKFRGDSSPSTWIYRVGLNAAIAWQRKERKYRDRYELTEEGEPVLQRIAEREDDRVAWLYEQIHALDPIDRSLTLLVLDGYSHREIGDMLGISESNVSVKLHRIKKSMTKQKEENGNDNGV